MRQSNGLLGLLLLVVGCMASIASAAAKQPDNFVFAGQQLDVALFKTAPKALARKGAVTEKARDGVALANVLAVDGIAYKKVRLSADFGYTDNGRLSYVTITVPKKQAAALYKQITKGAKAIEEEPGVLAKGAGRARLVVASEAESTSQIVLETNAVHTLRTNALRIPPMLEKERSGLSWWQAGGALLLSLGIFVVWTCRRDIAKGGIDHRLTLTDSAVAAITLLVAFVVGMGWDRFVDGFGSWVGALMLFGYWRLLAWAVGATRSCGWIPGSRPWHSVLALVLTPLLLVPAVIRKAVQSVKYCRLVFFQAHLVGLLYYFFPDASPILVAAFLGAAAPGLVRLYGVTYKAIQDQFTCRDSVAFLLTIILWPITLALGVLITALGCLTMLLGFWWIILIAFILGVFLGVPEIGFVATGLLMAPSLLNFGATGLLPTGFGNAGYSEGFGGGMDSFTVNPANGMPMMGGMGGVDTFGNPFGTNINDPY